MTTNTPDHIEITFAIRCDGIARKIVIGLGYSGILFVIGVTLAEVLK